MKLTAPLVAVLLLAPAAAGLTGQTPAGTRAFQGPVLVWAPGNASAAYDLFRTMDVASFIEDKADAYPVVERYKSLVLVPSFYLPDPDYYGDNDTAEDRVRFVIARAQKHKVPILLLDTGGLRVHRPVVELAADAAHQMLVVSDSPSHSYLAKRAAERGVPLQVVAGPFAMQSALRTSLGAKPRPAPGALGEILDLRSSLTADKSTFDISSLRGRWVAVYFWFVSSAAYLSASTAMNEAEVTYGKQVHFVGVAVDTMQRVWRGAIAKMSPNWTHLRNGNKDADLMERFGILETPAALLVDPEGRVVVRVTSRSHIFHEVDPLQETADPRSVWVVKSPSSTVTFHSHGPMDDFAEALARRFGK